MPKITHGDCRGGRCGHLVESRHGMIQRCENPNATSYPSYGARGITICKAWRESYQAFKDWALLHGYQEGLCLDRIDNDGNYCPENCRWVTRAKNASKRRGDRTKVIDQAFLIGVRLGLALGKNLTKQY